MVPQQGISGTSGVSSAQAALQPPHKATLLLCAGDVGWEHPGGPRTSGATCQERYREEGKQRREERNPSHIPDAAPL